MKPIDLSKFQKTLTKSIPNISFGFRDPKTWISTGNYALNYRISGDFHKGFPIEGGKMTLIAGQSGSCKSYLASGSVVKWCQENGVLPVIIDTESALDEEWMKKFDIDTNGQIMKVSMSLLNDIAKFLSDFIEAYKEEYKDVDFDDKPRTLFIIDSLGMTVTPTEVEHFSDGNMKGDMGLKQKQIYSICRNFLGSCANEPIGMIATQHTYASQNMFSPDAVIAGGSALEFTPSIVIAMEKRKLKEDDDGNKTTDVRGVKVDAVVRKTRYTQPFQKVTFNVPYDSGIDPYSGLFDLFSESLFNNDSPILKKEGNQYVYSNLETGEQVFKKFRKNITNEDYDMIMEAFMKKQDNDKLAKIANSPSKE